MRVLVRGKSKKAKLKSAIGKVRLHARARRARVGARGDERARLCERRAALASLSLLCACPTWPAAPVLSPISYSLHHTLCAPSLYFKSEARTDACAHPPPTLPPLGDALRRAHGAGGERARRRSLLAYHLLSERERGRTHCSASKAVSIKK